MGKKEEEEKKEESLEVSGRLRRKKGLSAGKGAGNALTIGSAAEDVNYTSYTYGVRSTGMEGKKIWILHICIICMWKRGHKAIYFNC